MSLLRHLASSVRSAILPRQVGLAGGVSQQAPAVWWLSQRFFSDEAGQGKSQNKLFIGGLSWHVDETTLKEAFSSFGDVSDVKIVMDRITGRSRGFGFVTMSDEANARDALREMNGREISGRTVRVDFAQAFTPRGPPKYRSPAGPRDYSMPLESESVVATGSHDDLGSATKGSESGHAEEPAITASVETTPTKEEEGIKAGASS